jgi:hypothetical protein
MLGATAGRCVPAVVLPWLAPTGRTSFTGSGREPTRPATVQLPAVLSNSTGSVYRRRGDEPDVKWGRVTVEQPP